MKPRPGLRGPGRRAARPLLERLERRIVLAVLEVVPDYGFNGQDNFVTLQSAVDAAESGDVVQIEPGSNPGTATVFGNNIVIQGDPLYGGAGGLRASGAAVPTITIAGNNVTISRLYLSGLTINAGVTGTTLAASIVAAGGSVSQAFATGNNGTNTIIGNTFLDGASLALGNSPGSTTATASKDQVVDNVFYYHGLSLPITVSNESTGLLISGNRVTDRAFGGSSPAITVTDSAGVVTGNTIRNPAFEGILIQDTAGTTRPDEHHGVEQRQLRRRRRRHHPQLDSE